MNPTRRQREILVALRDGAVLDSAGENSLAGWLTVGKTTHGVSGHTMTRMFEEGWITPVRNGISDWDISSDGRKVLQ